jgi:site-specific DNA-cytosine methylase
MASTGDSPASKQERTGGTSPDNMTATPPSTTSEVRALEFYCGVGGLHYSLLRARSRHTQESTKVVGAFDINPNANDTYEHNFGVRPCANSLYAVPPAKFDKLNANLWLMSPPCQPFTRQGHQKDVNDGRSQSFLRLIDILPELKNKPDHLLVENVVGFEVSEVRKALLKALRTNGYTCREFVLSPRMFGVPYSRPRYFCVAKRVGLRWKKIGDEDGGQRGVTDSKVSGNEVDGRDLKQHCLEESEMKESHREAGCDDDIHSVIHRVPPPSCLSDPTHWVPAGFLRDLESTDPTVRGFPNHHTPPS